MLCGTEVSTGIIWWDTPHVEPHSSIKRRFLLTHNFRLTIPYPGGGLIPLALSYIE
jgi:hypothetical protein